MKKRNNAEWLRELRSQGNDQAQALVDLRDYLLRAALYSYQKNRAITSSLDHTEIEQLAEDSAQNALLTILQHLDDFRGESKFTTWAFKFAINFALVSARREQWKHVSLERLLAKSETGELAIEDDRADTDPDRAVLVSEVWQTITEVIENDLTERQRQIIRAMVFEDVPLDEVVRHLKSNRNAVYKLLHDARRKLKERLLVRGFDTPEMLYLFRAKP